MGGRDAIAQRKAYTLSEMRDLRSILGSLAEQERAKAIPGKTTVAGKVYDDLKNAVEIDIDLFSSGLSSNLKAKMDVATAYYRDRVMGRFGNETMVDLARVAKNNPEDVYKMIVRPGDVSDIQRLKVVVGESGFAPLRRKAIEEMVTAPDGTILSGPQIVKNMARYGKETLKELLTPQQLADVENFAKTRQAPRFLESEVERKLRGLIFQSEGLYRAPEQVVQRIVDGDVVTLRAVKRIVGPQGMQQYKRRIIEDILGEATPAGGLPGQAAGPTALRISKNLKAYDENFIKEVFSKQELAQIEQIEQIRSLLESQQRLVSNSSNTAAAIIAPIVSSGIGWLSFFNPKTGAAVTIGGDIVARLMTSEATRKLLIRGMDPKLVNNLPLYGQIAGAIGNAARENMKEKRINMGVLNK